MDRTTRAFQLADSFMGPLAVFREVRNRPYDEQVAVAHVLRNRATNPQAPYAGCQSVLENVLKPYQFSSFSANDPNAVVLPNPNSSEWSAWESCVKAWDESAAGNDSTLGANAYHHYPLGHPAWPKWATTDKLTVKIGLTWLYKL